MGGGEEFDLLPKGNLNILGKSESVKVYEVLY